MDVIVSRSGGLAGLRLTWEVRVDEQPDADDWYILIAEIPWSQPPPAPPEPDRFVYRIRCAPHEATLAERQLVGPWRELVDRVQETTEPERAKPWASDDRRPPTPGSTRSPRKPQEWQD
jgi:Emfourin